MMNTVTLTANSGLLSCMIPFLGICVIYSAI